MRKFKEVKRKEIIYDMTEWKQIEKAAAKVSMQTSEYRRQRKCPLAFLLPSAMERLFQLSASTSI